MMLFNLSYKNFKKSIKDYTIYFFTLILGVSIFYVFNSIETQSAMMQVSNSTREIIQLLVTMISGFSVFIAIILGFLIIYASGFLIKRRKKEFGIYMLLGMGKGKISKLLLLETIIIGIFSLVIGLLLGIGLSQIMSVIVARMFEADMTDYTFIFSSKALIKTIIYFGIMYLLVMIFNTISIGKQQLINLINAKKKNETVKIKNTWACLIVFIIAAILLGYSYYTVAFNVTSLNNIKILIVMAMGAIGTFLLFWSLSGFILRLVKSRKKIYYKNLNTFILRQVDSKINTAVVSMTIISLLLFLTIGALACSISLSRSATLELKELVPVDFQASIVINEENNYTVKEKMEDLELKLEGKFKDYIEVNLYKNYDFTLESTLSTGVLKNLKENYTYVNIISAEEVMKISDYNKMAKYYDKKQYSLKDNEYLIIANFESIMNYRNYSLKENKTITINNQTLSPKFSECKDGYLDIAGNRVNMGIIIVPDSVDLTSFYRINYFIGNYKSNDKEEIEKIDTEINNLICADYQTNKVACNTKLDIYEASLGLGAMVTFIGMYLGIMFLISSTAILALKELSESADNKHRYNTLRQLGVDNKMIDRALFIQIAIFFLLPLLVALIHSIFGIKFVNTMLITFGDKYLLSSIIVTALIIVIVYGGYFLITYICSKNIINETN